MSNLSIYLIIFLSSFLSLIIFKALSHRIALIDVPNSRKKHQGQIPLVGGISIFFGMTASLILFFGVTDEVLLMISAMLILLITGVQDDRKYLSVRKRIMMQLLIVFLIWFETDISLTNLGNLLSFGDIIFPLWFSLIFTSISIIGLINAINMIDGIDGLAGIVSFVGFIFISIIMSISESSLAMHLILGFCVSMIPFILFNLGFMGVRNKVFLGDSGSMLLGFVIAWISIVSSQEVVFLNIHKILEPTVVLWIFGLPIMDTLAIIIRRIIKGKSPFLPDRDHIHHLFLRIGYSDKYALFFISILSALFGGFGLFQKIYNFPVWLSFLLFLISLFLYSLVINKAWKTAKFLRKIRA